MKPSQAIPFTLIGTLLIIASGFLLESCEKAPLESNGTRTLQLPDEAYDYEGELEEAWLVVNGFSSNVSGVVDNDVATLGRVLFYDPQLSQNNRTSCASCHHQSKAFSDGEQLSQGFVNATTKRNSLGIQNLFTRFSSVGFFWDGRAATLQEQVLMPISDHVEMGMEDTDELLMKLGRMDYYPSLFEKAFGSEEITEDAIATALTQFVMSIPSYQSKYDAGNFSEFSNFTAEELRGLELFTNELPCGGCHRAPTFENYTMSNIGLDQVYEDKGRGEWEGEGESDGYFLTPTLRNIALTAPYMHDGRYATLEEVIEFYNSSVQSHANLDYRLRDIEDVISFEDFETAPPKRLNLSDSDKKALIAFMHTLTDRNLMADPKYSDPFVVMPN